MNSVENLLSTPFSSRSLQEQIEIKKLGRPKPDLPNFIQNVKSGKRLFNRKFSRGLYTKCSWMCACEKKQALFCFPCLLFGGEVLWTKSGFKDLNHFGDRTKNHEASTVHIKNNMQLAFLGTSCLIEQSDDAYKRSIEAHNEQVKRNRNILSIIINSVRSCGVFELALRRLNEPYNPGVFRELIDFSAEFNIALKNHMESVTAFSGTSKTIQTQLLQAMLEVNHEKIADEIKQANFLAIIADETSDVSNTFQIALVFRYIVKNKPVERFWGFLNPPQHDATALATCILDQLKFHKITSSKLIAQTYDGASFISGKSNSVQAIVKKSYPNAHYVHCHAHELNLIIMKAACINRDVRVFYANVQGICAFISSSPQRIAILDEVRKIRLPRSIPTKWNFQSRNVMTICEHKEDFIECMRVILESDYIKNDSTLDQASGFIKILSSQSFNFWLSFFRKIIPLIETIFSKFQNIEMDPNSANHNLSRFESNILKIRNNIDTEEPNSSHSSPLKKIKIDKNEWKKQAMEVCDLIIYQIRERFSSIGHLIAASLFAYDKFSNYEYRFPENNLKWVCNIYDFLDQKKLRTELQTIYSALEFRRTPGSVCLYHFLVANNLNETFSETVKLLDIIITTPMTTLEAERCFSTLQRIKTFLRNTVSEDRTSALAMLSIEQDLLMDILDFNQKVVEKFACLKERNMDFLLK